MKQILFSAVFAFGLAMPAAHAALDTNNKCVQAALADTLKEFPYGQTVTTKFYEYSSYNQASWGSFTTRNLKFDGATELSRAIVSDEIKKSFSSAEDQEKKEALLSGIKGKKIFSVSFEFYGGDLERFYQVESDDGYTCTVKHIDTKIDDFDNG